MHKSQINRAVSAITDLLRSYGMAECYAVDRARNIASVGITGERITPALANEMLTPTQVIKGIPEDHIRHKVAIQVARHWIACTSISASSAWMRLHLQLGMTRYKAAEWLNKNGYVGFKMRDCLQSSGHRDAKYQGGQLNHCIAKLEKSVRQMKELN